MSKVDNNEAAAQAAQMQAWNHLWKRLLFGLISTEQSCGVTESRHANSQISYDLSPDGDNLACARQSPLAQAGLKSKKIKEI